MNKFKLGIIILAHNLPEKLEDLVLQLQHEYVKIYIHIDKRNALHFESFINKFHSYGNITIDTEYCCKWGHSSLLDATLSCMKKLVLENDYCVLLSGEDFLLRKIDNIYNFFNENRDYNFLDYRKYKNSVFWGDINIDTNLYFGHLLNKIFILPFLKKKNKYELYYSSQWLNLNQKTLIQVLNFIDNHPNFYNYFQYSYCSDAFIFTTVVSIETGFLTTVNHSLRYIDWDSNSKNSSIKVYRFFGKSFSPRMPKYINTTDIPQTILEDKLFLFARKLR